MAGEDHSGLEQIKQLMRDMPLAILQPPASGDVNSEKIKAVGKYIYPGVKTTMCKELQKLFKSEFFTSFGDKLNELDKWKKEAEKNVTPSNGTPKPGLIGLENSKIMAYNLRNFGLRQKLQKNQTEIESLMAQVEQKRNHINQINSELERF